MCSSIVWADKILVGTFIGENNLTDARNRLESIPLDTEDNIQFVNVYDPLLTALENGIGSGKTAEARSKIHHLSSNINSHKESVAFAESALALLEGKTYVRKTLNTINQLQNESIKPSFILSPNPANNLVNIQFLEGLNNIDGQLLFFDAQGTLIKTHFLKNRQSNLSIDISSLNAGIYIVQWLGEDGQKISHKLVVY